ncbi:MAG: tandem-95 repeat protein [Acidobacteria bacterium]|nr:MAG: tandem-95 repeat protein [Acidobacteriota bacterium]
MRVRLACGFLLALFGVAATAGALTSQVAILVDADDDGSSGCVVPTAEGELAGVEHQILVETETFGDGSAAVQSVRRRDCESGVFGAPVLVDAGGWPVGIGLGEGGRNVVESYVPMADLAVGRVIRFGITHETGADADALLEVAPGTGIPITLLGASPLEIPTLSQWGALLLILLLCGMALGALRRRDAALLITLCMVIGVSGAAWAVCIMDGQIDDWSPGDLLASDASGEAPTSVDLEAFFAKVEDGVLCLRVDTGLAFNQAPSANPQAAITPEDTALLITLTGSDPDGDALAFTIAAAPTQGTLGAVTPVGPTSALVQYTPATDVSGSDAFTFQVDDGLGGTDTAVVELTVVPVNDAPTAAPQTVTTAEDTAVLIVLVGADVDGDPLTFSPAAGPTDGSLSAVTPVSPTSAQVTYTPSPDFNGADAFTFISDDGSLVSAAAAVSITVTATDDPPLAVDDVATVPEDAAATPIDVLSNDLDPDGGPRSVASVTQPVNGVADVTGGGTGLTYQPNGDYCNDPPGGAADTFTYTLAPGDTVATVSVSVSCIDDPPVVDLDADDDQGTAGNGFAISFTDGSAASLIEDPVDATITDVDDVDLVSLTVTLTNLLNVGDEILDVDPVVLAGTSIGASYDTTTDPSRGVLTLTGPDDLASFIAVLRTVTYENTSMDPDPAARLIEFVAEDGTSAGVAAVCTVTLVPVDDPPVVTTSAGSIAFTEGGGAVTVDAGLTVTDVDSADLSSATVAITNLQDGAAEVLSATCPDLTVTPSLGALALDGIQPLATYQACLASVTYDNSSQDPDTTTRVISFTASDATSSSTAATRSVTIGAVDDPPVVTTSAGATVFTEDAGAVVVDPGIVVVDVDSADLSSATVAITNLQDGAAEVLAAGACGGLTVTPGPGSLSITGTQPPATYQTCLASVTYDNGSEDPGTTARSISFVVTDATSSSVSAFKTVTVSAVDDPPTVTTSAGTSAFTEDGGAIVVDAGISVADVDSANLVSATVTITNPQDGAAEMLGVGACGGLTVTPGAGSLTITGPQPAAIYQSCLASVTFDDSSQDPDTTTRVISFVVADGTSSGVPATKGVTVATVDDAPVVTTSVGASAFTEDGGSVVVDAGISVADLDSADLVSATVVITNPQNGAAEVLSAGSCGGLSVVPGPGSLSINGSGSVAAYQSCLASVSYDNSSQDPGATARVVSFVVSDGTSSSAAVTRTVDVTPVNDPPLVATTGGVTSFTEDLGAVAVDAALSVSDPDNASLASATVTIVAAPDGAAESLAVSAACPGLLVVTGNPLSVSGVAPVVDYQSCLRSVTYENASQNPDATARTVRFVVTDGADPSSAGDRAVSVTPVNDPPIAGADVADYIGNTLLHFDNAAGAAPAVTRTTGSGLGVLDNDSDPAENDPLSITGVAVPLCGDVTAPFSCATANGGSVVLEADGRFTFTPREGEVATSDSFEYRLSDGTDTVHGLVTLTRIGRIWFVRNDAAAGGLGRSADPFDTLAEAQAVSVATDTIYVFSGDGTTTGQDQGIVLGSAQRLIGEGVELAMPFGVNGGPVPTLLRAAGARPLLDNVAAAGNAVSSTDAIPAEIAGLSLAATANAIDVTTTGAFAGSGSLEIRANVVRGAGAEGLDVNAGGTGTLTLEVQGNTWDTTGTHVGNAVDIVRTGGLLRLAFGGNSNILSASTAVNVNGGATALTTITSFTGNSVHQATAGNGIVVSGATFDATPGGVFDQVAGGTTLVGAPGDGVGGSAMVLSTVAGDLSFTDLDLFAGNGSALAVSGAGPVNVGAGTGTRVTVGAGVATFQSTGGPAVDVASATVDLQPTSISSTNSPTVGVSLLNVADGTTSSTFSAGAGSSISNATGTAFFVDGGNATVSYAGSISNGAGRSVVVQNRNADSVTFTGAITDTGTGILVNSNTGSTIGFTGTLGLSTGANAAFTATGGGTVTSTGAASTLTTTTASALNVTNTTIGSAGLTFRSVSSAGGSSPGIVLSATGNLGGLTVTGTGAATTGGTIEGKSGNGILLSGTRGVSLTSMRIRNNLGSGIAGDDVTNFSLISSTVTDNADTTGGTEAGLRFDELLGTCAITNSTVSGSVEDNIRLTSASGVLTDLAISGSTIGPNNALTGGSGLAIVTTGSAAVTVNITGSTFTGNRASGILTSLGSNGAHEINVSTTNFQTHNTAIDLGFDFDSDLTFDVSNNTNIVGNTANAINIVSGTTTTNSARLRGTIDGNTIGSGAVDSGSTNAFGIAVDLRGDVDAVLSITNNPVRNTDIEGIFVQTRLDNDADAEIGLLDLTLRDNTVSAPDDNSAFPFGFVYGTRIESRNTSDVCMDISGNTSAGVGGAEHFRVRQRDTSTFRIERLALGSQSAATTQTFVAGQNDAGSTASTTVATSFTGVANGTCRKP